MKVIPYVAEYIGTFFFILCIFASAGNPLIIGASLALVVFLIYPISGGYMNPAVSLAMYMNGTLKQNDMLIYIIFQILGGLSAFYAYKMAKR